MVNLVRFGTYRFEAKYEGCSPEGSYLGLEILGRCQHPVVQGSGTGVFDGVSRRLDLKDDIEAGNYPYRGHSDSKVWLSSFRIHLRIMKNKFSLGVLGLVIITQANLFCKKELSCENCREDNKPPLAIAGPDQVINLPADNVSLDGAASNDPDGTISGWLWTKISGPSSFSINNETTSKPTVKVLDKGVYQFELKVIDDKNLSAKDTVQIIANDPSQPNRPPVANAGKDQIIVSPANIITLNGDASTDPDNNIITYQWTKISGPSSLNISNSNSVQTQVTNLVEGFYQFEIKVTDGGGLIDKDTMQVRVKSLSSCSQSSLPPPCTANCGKIVFVSDRDGNNEIYTCHADGSNVTRLTNHAAMDEGPVWSPDGTRIAFIRGVDSNEKYLSNLFIMNADGSNVVQKTFTNDAKNPTWSPDGTRLLLM